MVCAHMVWYNHNLFDLGNAGNCSQMTSSVMLYFIVATVPQIALDMPWTIVARWLCHLHHGNEIYATQP